jgi:hypothetical protein
LNQTALYGRLPTKLWYQVHTHLHVGPFDIL